MTRRMTAIFLVVTTVESVFGIPCWCADSRPTATGSDAGTDQVESLRLAVVDLIETFGTRYPKGPEFLARLVDLEKAARDGEAAATRELLRLRNEALLANPLLDFDDLLLLKRRCGQLGLPVNHKCNSGIEQTGYDNEIAMLSSIRTGGRLRTVYRPQGSEFVGELDLHFDADRLLFTMPVDGCWQIWEIEVDGSELRQVSRRDQPDVDNFDACYLPDGRIVFASTASFHAVPCWHGVERACSLYRMNADGIEFTLPTEAQWEYACRAGSAKPLSFGDVATDFSQHANVADRALSLPPGPTGGLKSNFTAYRTPGIFLSATSGGNVVCDTRFDDRAVATAPVGSYGPNAWGLYDMHGNAAEWTRSSYRQYPYDKGDGRNQVTPDERKAVRGGLWVDRPSRCRSAFRLGYPAWQRVHNVGFRVVCERR